MDFSTKIKPLPDTKSNPMPDEAMAAYALLKKDMGNVTLMSIDEDQDFVVETFLCKRAKFGQNWTKKVFLRVWGFIKSNFFFENFENFQEILA